MTKNNNTVFTNQTKELRQKAELYLGMIKNPAHGGDATLFHRIAHGTSWTFFGAVINNISILAMSIAVARILGKTGFGELGIIQSTVGMFGVLAGLGLGLTASKYVAEYRQKDPIKAGRIMALSSVVAVLSGGIISLVLIVFAPLIANRMLAAPHLTGVLQIGSGLLFLGALNGTQTGALLGLEAFKKIAFINALVGLLSFPIIVIGAWFWGLEGVIIGLVAAMGINLLFNHIALQKRCREIGIMIKISGCWVEKQILWKFSLPAIIYGIISGTVIWVAGAMLVNQPDGYSEMGLFNAANQWRTLLLFIPLMVGQTIIPIMSERYAHNGMNSVAKIIKSTILVNGVVTVPAAVVLAILSPWIMSQYGPSFTNGWPVLIVVLATGSLMAIQTPVVNFFAASGHMWLGSIIVSVWGIVMLAATWFLLPYGAMGLAIAYLIAFIIQGICLSWFIRHKLYK